MVFVRNGYVRKRYALLWIEKPNDLGSPKGAFKIAIFETSSVEQSFSTLFNQILIIAYFEQSFEQFFEQSLIK